MPEFDDILAHYGRKGMKWGVRTKDTTTSPGLSSDAAKAKQHRATAKLSGSKTLSNDELKQLIERMNLERQFSTLSPTPSKTAKKFVSEFLLDLGKQEAKTAARNAIKKSVAKTIATAAAAAAARQGAKKVLAITAGK